MAITSVASTAAVGGTVIAAHDPEITYRAVENTDANILYLVIGEDTPSATNYTVSLASGDYFEVPSRVVTMPLKGIWAVDGAGAALVTSI